MFQTIKNAWKVPELRNKLLFTLAIVIIYRFGAVIPVPYVSQDVLASFQAMTNGSIFQYLNILSGGAFSQATLFALSISPYITASIVIQLLAVAIPALERLSKEGEEGKKKLTMYTRWVTVILGLVTSIGYYMYLRNNDMLTDNGWFAAVVIIACYCAGSALIMWLSEKINEQGIGNGISIILFANIVAGLPSVAGMLWSKLTEATLGGFLFVLVAVIIALAVVTFVVFMTNSERRLPVQYAKKVVGRKMYGGQSSNLPIKLNMTGVMPIIFANSIVAIPTTIALFVNPAEGTWGYNLIHNVFASESWPYAIIFFILIIAFSYFYITISFNPIEISNNLKKNGGFIPGIRPGRPTSDYITKVLNRITLIGALFLGVIAVFPLILNIVTGGQMQGIAFGGSSLLIVVGVVLELAREIEAQMTLRHYKGFLE